jgi:diguanylate cyclase (GGDEF)-like protein
LSEVARVLETQCRTTDTLARVGGEEFMVLLVDCNENRLSGAAERFRAAVEAHVFTAGTEDDLAVTTSLGATLVRRGDSIRDILQRADKLLYRAKDLGRNKAAER